MIAKLIDWCIRNRAMVLLLCGFLVARGRLVGGDNITVDAIPDLSDVQVVIRTEYPGQAPQIVEDQVTYPLTTAMLAVPYAKVVRGYSMFGTSFVYIIFEDGTDLYWARSRVLEQLSSVTSRLPRASPATRSRRDGRGLGLRIRPHHRHTAPPTRKGSCTIRSRTMVRRRGRGASEMLASDWCTSASSRGRTTLPARRHPARANRNSTSRTCEVCRTGICATNLTAVDGVSEVAPIGGFVKQYQVVVDPVKLLAFNLPLQKVKMAIQRSNNDVGGRLIEKSENEYMVRGLGYLGSYHGRRSEQAARTGQRLEEAQSEKVLGELRKIALGANADGSPIYLADVAEVRIGPDIRRGVAEWNGRGRSRRRHRHHALSARTRSAPSRTSRRSSHDSKAACHRAWPSNVPTTGRT